MNDQIFCIIGRVIDRERRSGIARLRIEAWDKEIIYPDVIGSTVTDDSGAFQFEFSMPQFQEYFGDRQPELFFKIFHGEKMVHSTEESLVWKMTEENPDIVIEVGLIDSEGKRELKIEGQVITPEGAVASGLTVMAVDKSPGREVILGSVMTDKRGRYTILYKTDIFERIGKKKADIQVKIIDPADPEKVQGISSVRHNIESDQTFNLVLAEKPAVTKTEFAEISDQLSNHLGSLSLKDLREDSERQDISYFSGKSGWDARVIAMAVQAEKYNAEYDIPSEMFYALFRAGLPTESDRLFSIQGDAIKKAWEKAIEKNILPSSHKRKLSSYLNDFEENRAAHLLNEFKAGGISTFKELLDISLPDSSKQKELVKLYYNQTGGIPGFWKQVETKFGANTAARLQLDGKLGYLTMNNAPLIKKLKSDQLIDADPGDLIQHGLYKSETWDNFLSNDIPLPQDLPSGSNTDTKSNYARYMASMLNISYPSAVVAEMVKNEELPLKVDASEKTTVYQFLSSKDNDFDIGKHPVEQYLKDNHIQMASEAVDEIKRLQRVYQISPSDLAMQGLMKNNFDSAYSIMKYDKQSFIDTYKSELGGTQAAQMVYAQAEQVHGTVLNIATAYRTYRTNPLPYAVSGNLEQAVDSGTVANPTLEELFGDLDYCTCEHCKSVLSPAAYLVDLLQFIDCKDVVSKENILDNVLLKRRPDIQHIELTCENTNVVLPYIDLVNEILEYYVINQKMQGFKGYNIDEYMTSTELLANPQNVKSKAYSVLLKEVYPFNLPYNDSLQALRLYYNDLEVPLYEAMEKLRADDSLDKTGTNPYGWRDIYLERLEISPQEYKIFTDSSTHVLAEFFGMDKGTSDAVLIKKYSNAKIFSRKTGITYNELIRILKTQFINPCSRILSRVEALQVDFSDMKALKDGDSTISDAEFEKKLPENIKKDSYGGDIQGWVKSNFSTIEKLILLTRINKNAPECKFSNLELRYISGKPLKAIDFWRLLRFIRLWKKCGTTIEETDKIIFGLYKKAYVPLPSDSLSSALKKLDDGFKVFFIKLAHFKKVQKELNISDTIDLLKLLAVWSDIDTHGKGSLYRKMFLHSAILKIDNVFEENDEGIYLSDPTETIGLHLAVLRAAFNLTDKDLTLIKSDSGLTDSDELNLSNVSKIFRYAFLKRSLSLSIEDFISLKILTDIDPFIDMENVQPSILKFIKIAKQVSDLGFEITKLDYLFRHIDSTGQALPGEKSVLSFANTLKQGLVKIEKEHQVKDDPDGKITKAKMALVYESDVVDEFFGLLKEVTIYSVSYSQTASSLDTSITNVTTDIFYDDINKQLCFKGIMSKKVKDNLITATSDTILQAAINKLYKKTQIVEIPIYTLSYTHSTDSLDTSITDITENISYDDINKQLIFKGLMTKSIYQSLTAATSLNNLKKAIGKLYKISHTLFSKYPDLEKLYNSKSISYQNEEDQFEAILKNILPDLKKKLKQIYIEQTLSAGTSIDPQLPAQLLEEADVMNAVGKGLTSKAAIEDFLALETDGDGVSYAFYFSDTISGTPKETGIEEDGLAFDKNDDDLSNPPVNTTTPSGWISVLCQFYLEVPSNENYNFYIETDTTATVSLSIDDKAIVLSGPDSNGIWKNTAVVSLKAGILNHVKLEISKFKDKAILKWKSKGIAMDCIPAKYMIPYSTIQYFRSTYIRYLKAVEISTGLGLNDKEFNYICSHTDYLINGKGFPKVLPIKLLLSGTTVTSLMAVFTRMLQYTELKKSFSITDETFATLLLDPEMKDKSNVLKLLKVTGWGAAFASDFAGLLVRFAYSINDLTYIEKFIRVEEAVKIVKTFGISVSDLLLWTSNDPKPDKPKTVRDIQAVLKAKYDESQWFKKVQPISDKLRDLRRDVMVTHILHLLSKDKKTEHINTGNKLFEYMLIDVEMESCMKTSRIKQALSSIQLFIQRCLLNLEKYVSPKSINADQWKWMNRYRVWEANRKVFLYPENWLDPEFRDDKSSFFQDLEGELLQADITEELAYTAYVNYLEKLDEVAKLEIIGMCVQEYKKGTKKDDVLHVIARTAGASKKYYYRKLEGGNWSPWEKINLDIEDTPVLPLIWQDRLFLFWLNVVQKGQEKSSLPQNKKTDSAINLKLSDIDAEAKANYEITLSWSEYSNGKWKPRKTTDMDDPIILKNEIIKNFNRTSLSLTYIIDNALHIFIGNTDSHFKFHHPNSNPIRKKQFIGLMISPEIWREISCYEFNKSDGLIIRYYDKASMKIRSTLYEHEVLPKASDYTVSETVEYPRSQYPETPFFFMDPQYAFFVQTTVATNKVYDYGNIGIFIPDKLKSKFDIFDLVDTPDKQIDPIPELIEKIPWEIFSDPGFVDPTLIRRITPEIIPKKVISMKGIISFGGVDIGPMGSQYTNAQFQNTLSDSDFERVVMPDNNKK